MVKRLASFLRNRIPWSLALRAAGSGLVLAGLWFSGFHWALVGIYWIFFLAVYLAESFRRRSFFWSFWILAAATFFLAKIGWAASWPPFLPGVLLTVFAVFIAVLLGLMDFVFRDQFLVYNLFLSCFFLAVFSFFFHFQSAAIFLPPILLFFILFLLLREFFRFNGIFWPKREMVAAGMLALAGSQLAWIGSLLPISFINSAAFCALFLVLSRDAVLIHFQGYFSSFYLFRQLTFFVILSLFIFLISSWSL